MKINVVSASLQTLNLDFGISVVLNLQNVAMLRSVCVKFLEEVKFTDCPSLVNIMLVRTRISNRSKIDWSTLKLENFIIIRD